MPVFRGDKAKELAERRQRQYERFQQERILRKRFQNVSYQWQHLERLAQDVWQLLFDLEREVPSYLTIIRRQLHAVTKGRNSFHKIHLPKEAYVPRRTVQIEKQYDNETTRIAGEGIRTSGDFAKLFLALIQDTLTGDIPFEKAKLVTQQARIMIAVVKQAMREGTLPEPRELPLIEMPKRNI